LNSSLSRLREIIHSDNISIIADRILINPANTMHRRPFDFTIPMLKEAIRIDIQYFNNPIQWAKDGKPFLFYYDFDDYYNDIYDYETMIHGLYGISLRAYFPSPDPDTWIVPDKYNLMHRTGVAPLSDIIARKQYEQVE
jgi:hypothetical protein